MKARSLIAAVALLAGAPVDSDAQTRQEDVMRFLLPLMRVPPAVEWDGLSVLSYSGSLYNQPSSSQHVFINYWYNSDTPPGNSSYHAMVDTAAADTSPIVQVLHVNSSPATLSVYAQLNCVSAQCNNWGDVVWLGKNALPYDGKDHAITIQINTATNPPVALYKIDGGSAQALVTLPNQTYPAGSMAIPWNGVVTWNFGGSTTVSGVNYQGDTAEVYMDLTGALSISDSGRFVSFNVLGEPKAFGLGLNCVDPSGNIPQLCLRGNPAHFPLGPIIGNAGASYIFDLNNGGTIRTAKSHPCVANWFGIACAPAF